jgi:pimeloyl-ACP methyl ester carboxylesterase
VFAGKSIGQVADHIETIICGLERRPATIGHSFGGLLTPILAGRGLGVASVAIDPAPFRGVLPLPISALKSAFPVLGNRANRNGAVPLTYDQFRFAFVDAVSEDEAKRLYETTRHRPRLSDELDLIARDAGDTEIVVSATPSENTVRFYMSRGYELMAQSTAGAL